MLLLSLAGVVAASGSQATTARFIPSAQPEVPSCDPFRNIGTTEFPKRPTHNNKWLPLVPGTQFLLQGQANRGGGLLPHTITFTVTDLTKKINGVNVRVLWDVDRNESIVQEAELAFFVEDKRANIWLFGEYPEEWDGPIFKGAPLTWIAGTDGAEAGVQVPARPTLIGPPYIQGLAPAVGFFDCGKDVQKHVQNVCVPVGCFNDVYVTEEWNPDDPLGGFQTKYYAPRVGNISVGAVDDPEGETLVLGAINKLDQAGLKAAREEALKLDERAYLSNDAYRDTEPAQPGGKRPPPPPPALPAGPPLAPPPPALSGTGVTTRTQGTKPTKKKHKRKRCVSKRKRGAKKKGHGSKRPRCGSRKRARPKR